MKRDVKQKLTKAEQEIFDACPGVTHIVHSVDEALRILGLHCAVMKSEKPTPGCCENGDISIKL